MEAQDWFFQNQVLGMLHERVRNYLGLQRMKHEAFSEAIWSLARQGLIRLTPIREGRQLGNIITNRGKPARQDTEDHPDFGGRYLDRLRAEIPVASDLVIRYVTEAHRGYVNGCYLTSAVMLGVAQL